MIGREMMSAESNLFHRAISEAIPMIAALKRTFIKKNILCLFEIDLYLLTNYDMLIV